jgi:hypothetical protein
MRRIFEDERGGKIEQFDLWDYGYDARQRSINARRLCGFST